MTDSNEPKANDAFDDLFLSRLPPSLSEVMKGFSIKDIEETISLALTDLVKKPVSVSIQKLEYGTGSMFKDISISDMTIRPGSHSPDN
ncbi:hypothetical protein [Alcaligenes sp. Me129]|uniref:hypothetical protein n=1 Tax=Alcaligenes sp. Me129 TaxID=3392635 RepID=UPI003D1B3956